MHTTDPILLLTRPAPQAQQFAAAVAHCLHPMPPVLISPVVAIQPLETSWTWGATKLLILTSANAVALVGPRLADYHGRIACVGQTTAQTLRTMGREVSVVAATGSELLAELGTQPAVATLHLGAREVQVDFAAQLRALGWTANHVALYKQDRQALSAEAARAVQSGQVIAPVFSNNGAHALGQALATLDRSLIHPIAISKGVSLALSQYWPAMPITTSSTPDRIGMCQAVAMLVRQARQSVANT